MTDYTTYTAYTYYSVATISAELRRYLQSSGYYSVATEDTYQDDTADQCPSCGWDCRSQEECEEYQEEGRRS